MIQVHRLYQCQDVRPLGLLTRVDVRPLGLLTRVNVRPLGLLTRVGVRHWDYWQ